MTRMIKLLPYEPSFLDSFLEWRVQPLSVRYNPLQLLSKQELAQMLASDGSDLSDFKRHNRFRWFVEHDGVMVGTVALKNISHTMGYAEIGYGIAEAQQHRGIGTAAGALLVAKCFRQTPLRKLLAYVHEVNIGSCRVLEKLGFVREGLLREHYIINGIPENEVLFGLLRREWNAN
jgi:[ribosomal protein S5]-alanine N-acetyltransferase